MRKKQTGLESVEREEEVSKALFFSRGMNSVGERDSLKTDSWSGEGFPFFQGSYGQKFFRYTLWFQQWTKRVLVCFFWFFLSGLFFCSFSSSFAQTLPGSADAGRVDPRKESPYRKPVGQKQLLPDRRSFEKAPEGADRIKLFLRQVDFQGGTLFPVEELQQFYRPYLNREVTLSVLWDITDQIIKKYQDAGYFLSRAYLPEQEIQNGIVHITLVEGYIGEVDLPSRLRKNRIVRSLVRHLMSKRPVTAHQVESFLLRMNDLPGVFIQGIAEPMVHGSDDGSGAVRLLVRRSEEGSRRNGFISVDNFGSRFLGPYQASAGYSGRTLPFQESRISLSTSLPTDELKSFSIGHEVPLFSPGFRFLFSGGYVDARPGYTLEPNEIKSKAYSGSFGFRYQALRQRNENLNFTLLFEGKNTNSNVLGSTPLTRDRVRVLRAGFSYDAADTWEGYNILSMRVSQGLEVLGSSHAGDVNLSRSDADPGFTSFFASYTRQQFLGSGLVMIGHIAGQISTDPLFSSEEFGYGGERLGRSYDPSEMTGDHGLAGLLEVRYVSVPVFYRFRVIPFLYYDVGKVWNLGSEGQEDSGSSAGFGFRFHHALGFSASATLAFPLSRKIDVPLYGNGKNPRFLFQLGYDF